MDAKLGIIFLLFGPYIYFGTGYLVGAFWPRRPIGTINGVIFVFGFPISFLFIFFLTLSIIPFGNGPNTLGLGYAILTPLISLCSPLIAHTGWITGRIAKASYLPRALNDPNSMVYEVERFESMEWDDKNYPFSVMKVGDQVEFTGYRPHTAITHARKWEKKLRVQFNTLPSSDECFVAIERVR
ncbi:hypothetical protein [Roseibium sp. MMSF_3544]|uniref:hypothetical protein n=1 Tax=unclassified Roseibium TaxID=2629323 RepID=UPI00273D86A9|nr:hypothetical protein [Roseibium sp. MMSF_3544]